MTASLPSLRFHLALGLLALTGVASLILLSMEDVTGAPAMPQWALRSLALINPLILTCLALVIGGRLAHRVSLDAPVIRALSEGRGAGADWGSALSAGLFAALPVGILLFAANESLTRHAVGAILQTPILVRVLYGGITEEVIARWGCMTLVIWATWRLIHSCGPPSPNVYYFGILTSSLVFAAAHLPLVYASIGFPTPALIGLVIVANTAAGLVFGWLFWKRGLEAAMIAHAGAHAVALAVKIFR